MPFLLAGGLVHTFCLPQLESGRSRSDDPLLKPGLEDWGWDRDGDEQGFLFMFLSVLATSDLLGQQARVLDGDS